MSLIETLVADSITITPKGTLGADGRRQFDGTAVTTTARVTDFSGVLRPDTGREVTYDRVVYLKPTETVAVGDKITFDSTDHEIVELRRMIGISGALFHYKAMVKRIGA